MLFHGTLGSHLHPNAPTADPTPENEALLDRPSSRYQVDDEHYQRDHE